MWLDGQNSYKRFLGALIIAMLVEESWLDSRGIATFNDQKAAGLVKSSLFLPFSCAS
jgi:hypothetical protein